MLIISGGSHGIQLRCPARLLCPRQRGGEQTAYACQAPLGHRPDALVRLIIWRLDSWVFGVIVGEFGKDAGM